MTDKLEQAKSTLGRGVRVAEWGVRVGYLAALPVAIAFATVSAFPAVLIAPMVFHFVFELASACFEKPSLFSGPAAYSRRASDIRVPDVPGLDPPAIKPKLGQKMAGALEQEAYACEPILGELPSPQAGLPSPATSQHRRAK